MSTTLGFEVTLELQYEDAVARTSDALAAEGFGILTRIDVSATLKEKLGEEFRPYVILGACNPPLAHRALSANAEVGLMLPCNVTVEAAAGGRSLVRIADPELMLTTGELGDDAALQAVAAEARNKLRRVADALAGS